VDVEKENESENFIYLTQTIPDYTKSGPDQLKGLGSETRIGKEKNYLEQREDRPITADYLISCSMLWMTSDGSRRSGELSRKRSTRGEEHEGKGELKNIGKLEE